MRNIHILFWHSAHITEDIFLDEESFSKTLLVAMIARFEVIYGLQIKSKIMIVEWNFNLIWINLFFQKIFFF